MAKSIVKLNRSGNSHAGYTIRVITHGFYGNARLSASQRVLTNALYSFAQRGKAADFTFSEMCDRYNISYATVARTIKKILSLCFKKGDNPHSYELKDELPPPERYFYIPDWLRFAQFPTEAGNRDLTNIQIEVLAYILHQRKNLHSWTSTQANIARELGVAPSTVSEAISRLENLGILSVRCSDPLHTRCANHYERATFNLNHTLLNAVRKETLQHVKVPSRAAKLADAKTDRERFCSKRQELAMRHANAVREALGNDLEELERKIRILEMEIGKAQAKRQKEKIVELMERRKEIKQDLRNFLIGRGYTEGDLEPRPCCAVCNYNGRLSNGDPCPCNRRQAMKLYASFPRHELHMNDLEESV